MSRNQSVANIKHWQSGTKKRESQDSLFVLKAEREGFEPPVPRGTPVFKTGVFDHSTISPSYHQTIVL